MIFGNFYNRGINIQTNIQPVVVDLEKAAGNANHEVLFSKIAIQAHKSLHTCWFFLIFLKNSKSTLEAFSLVVCF
jgi:hypothetical protein